MYGMLYQVRNGDFILVGATVVRCQGFLKILGEAYVHGLTYRSDDEQVYTCTGVWKTFACALVVDTLPYARLTGVEVVRVAWPLLPGT